MTSVSDTRVDIGGISTGREFPAERPGVSPSTPSTPRAGRRIDDIEALRAIAVGLVLYEHANANLVFWHSRSLTEAGRFVRGWVGVDLFFAISGFVIARGLLPRLRHASDTEQFVFTSIRFWLRRAWRLLPTAWVWLAIPLVLSVAWNRSNTFADVRSNYAAMIAGLLDVANFRLAHVFGSKPSGAAFPYWSLSLEEQFYLLFPGAVFLFRRWLPALLIGLIALQFTMTVTPMSMMVRPGAICVGVLLASWEASSTYRALEPIGLTRSRTLRLIVLVGLLFVLTALGSDDLFVSASRIGLIALVAGTLVWIASYDRNYLCPRGYPGKIVLWLAARSYAIYVIHIPVYFATHELWFRLRGNEAPRGWDASLYVSGVLGTILLLAGLNDRLYADRWRQHGARKADRIGRAEMA